jgi:hypothetical protein
MRGVWAVAHVTDCDAICDPWARFPGHRHIIAVYLVGLGPSVAAPQWLINGAWCDIRVGMAPPPGRRRWWLQHAPAVSNPLGMKTELALTWDAIENRAACSW